MDPQSPVVASPAPLLLPSTQFLPAAYSASLSPSSPSSMDHEDAVSSPQQKPPSLQKKTKGRVKIKMEYIDNKLRRYTTFSKRKTGIMKKAYELSTLTGTQVLLLVASETGHVYTFATNKMQPIVTSDVGKSLIQSCLGNSASTTPVVENPQPPKQEFSQCSSGSPPSSPSSTPQLQGSSQPSPDYPRPIKPQPLRRRLPKKASPSAASQSKTQLDVKNEPLSPSAAPQPPNPSEDHLMSLYNASLAQQAYSFPTMVPPLYAAALAAQLGQANPSMAPQSSLAQHILSTMLAGLQQQNCIAGQGS